MHAYNKTYIVLKEGYMDIKALLPLLLAGNKNGESIAPLINAVSASAKVDKSDKSAENNSAGDRIINNNNEAMLASVLKNVMNGKDKQNKSYGIEQISGIANDEILGKIVRYLDARG